MHAFVCLPCGKEHRWYISPPMRRSLVRNIALLVVCFSVLHSIFHFREFQSMFRLSCCVPMYAWHSTILFYMQTQISQTCFPFHCRCIGRMSPILFALKSIAKNLPFSLSSMSGKFISKSLRLQNSHKEYVLCMSLRKTPFVVYRLISGSFRTLQ